MDVQMPEMDGLTATAYLPGVDPFSRPDYCHDGQCYARRSRECLEAMDDYISKPIRVEEMVQALSKCQPNREGGGERGKCGRIYIHLSMQGTANIWATAGENASAFLAELIDCYLEETPKQVQAIATAVAQGDANALRQAAHSEVKQCCSRC